MSGCGARCGIQRTREREREVARALARRVGLLGHHAAWSDASRLEAIATELVDALPVRAVLAQPDDGAEIVYCVATTEDATWVEHRSGRGARPESDAQTSLRVLLSTHGAYAALQEARFVAAACDDGLWVEERRLAGIEDRRMQHIVRGAQGILRRAGVTLLDAAFLAERDGDASLWERLFEADPAVTTVGVWVPGGEVAASRYLD